jgi:hypothetical protein
VLHLQNSQQLGNPGCARQKHFMIRDIDRHFSKISQQMTAAYKATI